MQLGLVGGEPQLVAALDLLMARPEWGTYFALGEQVIFIAEGTAYEVVVGDVGPVEIPPEAFISVLRVDAD